MLRNKISRWIVIIIVVGLTSVLPIGIWSFFRSRPLYDIEGIEVIQPESLGQFNILGFVNDSENTDFVIDLPEGIGEEEIAIGMVLSNKDGVKLMFDKDFTRMLYHMPNLSEDAFGIFTISNGKESERIVLGNGYEIPPIAFKNAYIIAQMIADKPDNPFLRCFPEDVAEVIEKSDSIVLILQGPATRTGEFYGGGHVIWGYQIQSKKNTFQNSGGKKIIKNILLSFITGFNEEAGLVGEKAESTFGSEECRKYPELVDLYDKLSHRLSKKNNYFEPKSLKINLSKDTKEVLKQIIPYLNISEGEKK